jgi:2-(1,2-epoxy-1,2-dihydrophenyl)acetyl-CoA isomerase
MKEQISIEFENEAFKVWTDESIAVIKIKSNAFFSLVDMDISRKILDWFDLISEKEEINVILILNEKGCLGNAAYDVFVTEIIGKEIKAGEGKILSEHDLILVRSKEINILNSFIRSTIGFRKLVVSGLNGTIATPFFGASLASNFRFGTEDMRISFSHIKYGIHAGGALPFLLPKYICIGKASEYIFSGGEISAEKALKIGLINKIIPTENFNDECIKESKRLSQWGSRYIRWTKHLLTPYKEDLIEYLHDEEKYIDHYKEIKSIE